MMKKIIRIVLLFVVVLLIAAVSIPLLFKDKLAESVRKQINKQVNATVDFEDVDLHLLKDFPSLSLEVDGLSVVNKEPFEGDTLVFAEYVFIDLPWKTLFSGGVDPYTISHFSVSRAKINLVTNEEGLVNYDIALAEEEEVAPVTEKGPGAALTLEKYELNDVTLVYEDKSSDLKVVVDSLYHKGAGDLSSAKTVLRTQSRALLTLVSEETVYMDRNPVDWDADLEMDLDKMQFIFKDNTAHINRLPLVFEGGVALPEEGVDIDLKFSTPSTDFKQFLSLIPEKYSGNLDGIDARGQFSFNGEVKGMLTEEQIPLFEIGMAATDAYFKYQNMPLAMEEINFTSVLGNSTANVKDTYMNIDNLHFKLAGDPLDVKMTAEELGGNPRVDMMAKGVLNLLNFSKLMPAGYFEDLEGVLKVDMRSRFDMASVEKGVYDQMRNQGALEVSNMTFTTDYLPNKVFVEKAAMTLDNRNMTLSNAAVRTGSSDLELRGDIEDYLQAMSDDGVIKGRLEMTSETLVVADLVQADTTAVASEEGTGAAPVNTDETPVSDDFLPGNLDLVINGRADKVVYDDIVLNNARTKMHLADQALEIQELSSGVFGGRVNLSGKVNGTTPKPDYNMSLQASEFDIASAFEHMDLLRGLLPLARAFEGELNSVIKLSGSLGEDLAPVLNTLTGSLEGGLKVDEIKKDKLGYVQSLNNTFSLVDLTKLGGKELEGRLDFKDGKVGLKPVKMNVNGMDAVISGTHELEGDMNYKLTVNVPASYLGSEVTKLASSLNIKDLDKRTIPVDILIGGALKQPTFTTNLDKATAGFVAQLTNEQKQQLIEKGKGELGNLINKAMGGKEGAAADSTAAKSGESDAVKEAANTLLNNLFKKKKDTTKNQ